MDPLGECLPKKVTPKFKEKLLDLLVGNLFCLVVSNWIISPPIGMNIKIFETTIPVFASIESVESVL